MAKSGIYAITSPSGKRYIGSAIELAQRRREHISALRRGVHKNAFLQRAADKYGIAALTFTIIEYCSESELFAREQVHIDAYAWSELYNLAPAAGGVRGYKFTAEQRAHQRVKALQTWARDEFRTAQRKRYSDRWAEPAERAAQSARLAAHYADPARRERVSNLNVRLGPSATNTSGYRGVSFSKSKNRWRAEVTIRGERHVRGGFRDAATAHAYRLYFMATKGVSLCM